MTKRWWEMIPALFFVLLKITYNGYDKTRKHIKKRCDKSGKVN
jgi:hypothetical protein